MANNLPDLDQVSRDLEAYSRQLDSLLARQQELEKKAQQVQTSDVNRVSYGSGGFF